MIECLYIRMTDSMQLEGRGHAVKMINVTHFINFYSIMNRIMYIVVHYVVTIE